MWILDGRHIGCKILQKIVVKVHKNNVDHINLVAQWEAIHFPQHTNVPPIIQTLNIMVDL